MRIKKITGLFLCMFVTSLANAATVNVVPEAPTFDVGQTFSVIVSGSDFPETGGATLGLSFDGDVLDFLGATLAPSSPFDTIVPSGIDNVAGSVNFISVLTPLLGPNAMGSFDAFIAEFMAVGPGSSLISIVDDGGLHSWTDPVTFTAIPDIIYNSGNVIVNSGASAVPLPGAIWAMLGGIAVFASRIRCQS